MCGWYCFPKIKFVPLVCARALSRQTAPRWFYTTATTLAFLLCAVVFNKSLKTSASIGPSLVLCLIHCRSPTPSAILLRLTELRSSSTWRSSISRQDRQKNCLLHPPDTHTEKYPFTNTLRVFGLERIEREWDI